MSQNSYPSVDGATYPGLIPVPGTNGQPVAVSSQSAPSDLYSNFLIAPSVQQNAASLDFAVPSWAKNFAVFATVGTDSTQNGGPRKVAMAGAACKFDSQSSFLSAPASSFSPGQFATLHVFPQFLLLATGGANVPLGYLVVAYTVVFW